MTPQTLTFTATSDQVAHLLDQLRISGTGVLETHGTYTIDGHGIKATASYAAPTLTVTINSKPFYAPMSAVEKGIREHLGN